MSGQARESTIIVMALLAFVALSLWIVSRTTPQDEYLPMLSTYSPQPDGVMALYELLEQLHYGVDRHGLLEYDYPPGGCMVLLEDPNFNLSAMFRGQVDQRAVELWLEGGGSMVVFSDPVNFIGLGWRLAAKRQDGDIFDDLDPAGAGGEQGEAAEQPPMVWAQYSAQGEEGSLMAQLRAYRPGQRFELLDQPPLLAPVELIEIAEPENLFLRAAIRRELATLLGAGNPAKPLVLYRKAGGGEIFWVTCPEIATNKWIRRADNHRLVLAILDAASRGRTIIFDEHLHGFEKPRHTAISLLSATTGGRLLLVLVAGLIMLYLGQAVPRARNHPVPVPPRRQASEMIYAQADLYRRAGKLRVVSSNLIEGLKRELMQAQHLARPPSAEYLLDWLAQEADMLDQAEAAVASYVSGTKLPRSQQELAQLARACDSLRARLLAGNY